MEFKIRFRDCNNHFNSYIFYDNLGDADVWSHLDSIATHPAGSRLRVDITSNIDYAFTRHIDNDHWEELDDDVILKAVVDSLPLLRTKGILFVKSRFGGKM